MVESRKHLAKPSFKLRELKPVDIEKCLDFFLQMVEHHRSIYQDDSIPYGAEQRSSLKKKLQRTDDNYLKIVAEREKEIVGLLTLEVKGATLEIDEILVDKKMRSKGIGTAFMEFARETAFKRNCREMKVSFAARNLQGLRLYHKAGLNCLGMIELFMPLTEKGKAQWYERGKKTRFLGFNCYY